MPGQAACRNMIGGSILQMEAGTLDRPVIDRTGITGKFDIQIKFSIDDSMRKRPPLAAASDEPTAPSIVAVFQQQLGLKLEATKGAVEFLAIGHVERPSEN
jgi:uncharacterized protein (TIGR03435 family)